MAGKKESTSSSHIKNICRNRRATFEYEIFDRIEAGIVLVGTEVKSLRAGKAMLEDAYARVDDGELWLIGCEIPEYEMGTHKNHKPKRPRKLLLHHREMTKLSEKITQKGFTIIPLQMYFKDGKVKVEVAVGRGKQLHDKRESLKKADAKRDIQRAMIRRR